MSVCEGSTVCQCLTCSGYCSHQHWQCHLCYCFYLASPVLTFCLSHSTPSVADTHCVCVWSSTVSHSASTCHIIAARLTSVDTGCLSINHDDELQLDHAHWQTAGHSTASEWASTTVTSVCHVMSQWCVNNDRQWSYTGLCSMQQFHHHVDICWMAAADCTQNLGMEVCQQNRWTKPQ